MRPVLLAVAASLTILAVSNGFAEDSPFTQSPDAFKKMRGPAPKLDGPGPGGAPAVIMNDDEVTAPPFVAALEGAEKIEVKGADGKHRDVVKGGSLQFGDSLAAPDGVTVRLAFDRGTQALVGAGAQLSVHEDDVAAEAGGAKPSVLQLEQGDVRTLVEVAKGAPDQPATAVGKFKFKIRTKTATMGVRGTDFVVSVSESGETRLNTVKGLVEIAGDPEQLRKGQGASVGAGTATRATTGGGIEAPRKFEVGAFLKQFHERHPALEPLFKGANTDSRSGMLEKKFSSVRKEIADTINVKRGVDPAAVRAARVERAELKAGGGPGKPPRQRPRGGPDGPDLDGPDAGRDRAAQLSRKQDAHPQHMLKRQLRLRPGGGGGGGGGEGGGAAGTTSNLGTATVKPATAIGTVNTTTSPTRK